MIAGKFHSLFLTESNKLYGLGYNRYGQLGISNSLYVHAESPVEIFTDGIQIKDVVSGSHHTLVLSEDNELYGFGAKMHGQLDGKSGESAEEQCSLLPIKLPDSMGSSKIVSIKASNLRSQLTTEDGQVWFWGGYFYDGRAKRSAGLKKYIDGFNLLNEEKGIPPGKRIVSHGMGFAHDTVMIED